ncbi:putative peptide modification system cyclase [Arenimonas sp. MALMAid1274]|uniref:putative peptide modification system cyclase n=1 Tax=Arenimonas sp. MALMAid1274 TaxID=3411630 RepID=UPI003BA03A98
MDATEPRSTHAPSSAPVTPVLRTVLLCDIVESTALVERMGDMRAVALMKQHDQLLRQALGLCHGQLIDKADGVLALFERPIQALDFALRYQRGLREIGAVEGLDLKARIGIHVGDVMTWANDPKDVLTGAKAFEVEGLAKPVAARLMNLALPGQILMSGMAQNLCHRAVGELGEASHNLRWLMHGRYNFKGVPAPMLVHEVGEPGLSPLRAPESGAKAWREVPVWRRPPMLALEVLLIGALGLALFWSSVRSPPAIAFAERDWVVVADLQNRTDEKLFDDSLDTALRVGLEQSRHINLVSQLQIDRALERMQRQGQPVDRQLATELALREGAKAVILPTVAEVGGVVRVSLEVIDPNSGVTVYSDSADGSDAGEVLPALDDALTKVRGRLGEALDRVESSHRPLETVTTSNLEALRAYSLGLKARYESRLADARPLFEEAIRLDPAFAMAHLNLAFLHYSENDAALTRRYLDRALENRDHLTQRELIFLEGAEATLNNPQRAVEKFKLLSELYPDEYRAYYNYAFFAYLDLLRPAEALEMMQAGLVQRNPRLGSLYYLQAAVQMSLNRYDQAIASFEQAESLGVAGSKVDFIGVYAAQRRFDLATRTAGTQAQFDTAVADLESRRFGISLAIDQGEFALAEARARELVRDAKDQGVNDLTLSSQLGAGLMVRSYQPDAAFADDLLAFAAARGERLAQADALEQRHVVLQILASAWMSARLGDTRTAVRLIESVQAHPLLAAYPANVSMLRIARAEVALAEGRPESAVALLDGPVGKGEGLYLERAVLMRARAGSREWTQALVLAQWLASNRGRAYGEFDGMGMLKPANLAESNLALGASAAYARELGQASQAEEAEAAFRAAWPRDEARALAARKVPPR